MLGLDGSDTISGGAGNDTIDAGIGDDIVVGGAGIDSLSGGLGNDIFLFNENIAEIGNDPALPETIIDLNELQDFMDFRAIDANTLLAGNQRFTYIGTAAAFTGAAQLRFLGDGPDGFLYGNVNADLNADFRIRLAGVRSFSGSALGPVLSVASLNGDGVLEGSANSSTQMFQLTLSRPMDSEVVVNWTLAGSGASPADSVDFVGGVVFGQVMIPAGRTSGTITVAVAGDNTFEANEGFTLTISTPTAGVGLGTTTASSIILNDDAPPVTTINGTASGDTLNGSANDDIINGLGGRDTINGNGGNDTINGGLDRDQLTGGAGADTFFYASVNDSPGNNPDRITDFTTGVDKIDLSSIDADSNAANGFTPFIFIGAAAFTALAQVRFAGGVLSMNTANGTNNTEMAINILNGGTVVATDLIL